MLFRNALPPKKEKKKTFQRWAVKIIARIISNIFMKTVKQEIRKTGHANFRYCLILDKCYSHQFQHPKNNQQQLPGNPLFWSKLQVSKRRYILPSSFSLDEDSLQEWRQRLQVSGQMSMVQCLHDGVKNIFINVKNWEENNWSEPIKEITGLTIFLF